MATYGAYVIEDGAHGHIVIVDDDLDRLKEQMVQYAAEHPVHLGIVDMRTWTDVEPAKARKKK